MRGYTTIEQSKKLLELGLSPESADMHYTNMCYKGVMYSDQFRVGASPYIDAVRMNKENIDFYLKGTDYKGIIAWEILPCWSVSALLELMPKEIEGIPFTIYYNKCQGWSILYAQDGLHIHISCSINIIDSVVEMVCWSLENGYIKKRE